MSVRIPLVEFSFYSSVRIILSSCFLSVSDGNGPAHTPDHTPAIDAENDLDHGSPFFIPNLDHDFEFDPNCAHPPGSKHILGSGRFDREPAREPVISFNPALDLVLDRIQAK